MTCLDFRSRTMIQIIFSEQRVILEVKKNMVCEKRIW